MSERLADPTPTLAALLRGDRSAALEHALSAWFGPPVHAAPAGMPGPLAALFTRFEAGLIEQNHLCVPERDRVFYVENQSCHEWALEDDTEDPRVIRDGEVVEAERLSGFAIQLVLLEASMGALAVSASACLDESAAEKLLSMMIEVPLQPWTWPVEPTRFHVARGVVAHTHATAPDETWIFASAISVEALEFLQIPGVDWTIATTEDHG